MARRAGRESSSPANQAVSPSRLSTFENCPLQYRYRYVDRLPPESVSIEAHLGRSVHAALEYLYATVRSGRVPPLEEVLAEYDRAWRERPPEPVRIRKPGLREEDYRLRGEGWIGRHYSRTAPFDGEYTLGVEVRVDGQLGTDGAYPLVGYVDRLARGRDGWLEIHDYKTSRYVPPADRLRKDRQLPLYQLALQQEWPLERSVRLVWHYLARDRRVEMVRTDAEIDEIRARARRLIDEIRAEARFLPRESALCDWCEYQQRCPVGRRREGAPGLSSRP